MIVKRKSEPLVLACMFHSLLDTKGLGAFSSKWSRMFDLLDNDRYIFKTGMAWKYIMGGGGRTLGSFLRREETQLLSFRFATGTRIESLGRD